jgi:hypothetical protein
MTNAFGGDEKHSLTAFALGYRLVITNVVLVCDFDPTTVCYLLSKWQ